MTIDRLKGTWTEARSIPLVMLLQMAASARSLAQGVEQVGWREQRHLPMAYLNGNALILAGPWAVADLNM